MDSHISKELIRSLYWGKSMSVFGIARQLNCSENRINYWIHKFSIPKRSISEAIYKKRNPNGDPFKIVNPKNLEQAKLMGFGLGLYWGEGNKKNKNSIRLGNTNPLLIKKFLEFLIKMLGIRKGKVRCGLQIFSDIDKNEALKFWLDELKIFDITEKNFFGITITPSRSIGTYREKSKYGVLTIHFCNTKLKKILDSMLPT